jgi:hypothetical protein
VRRSPSIYPWNRANIGAGPAQRPDQLSDPNLPGGQRTPDRWFDTSAFALPAQFTFWQRTAQQCEWPGIRPTSDFSLAKDWAIGRGSGSSSAGRVFNLFNRANFDLPNRTFGNPKLGRIFSAKSPREMAIMECASLSDA